MLVLGFQGSPRKNGNTDRLLAAFMEKARCAGAAVKTIQVARAGIVPCKGCGYCEKHGTCVIADDPMSNEVYGLLRQADLIVAASPVFFYGVSAQLKGLIDRSQTLWSRKYVYKLKDPLAATRRGMLLSVGASRGRQLFDGIHLTIKYFFDAVDARFDHSLTYHGIEAKGAILARDGLSTDIDAAIDATVKPLVDRRRLLFVSPRGACRGPMAAALAQQRFGDRIRAGAAALDPASESSAPMMRVMQKAGIDMGYLKPTAIDGALYGLRPDRVIVIGENNDRSPVPGVKTVPWPLPIPEDMNDEAMDGLFHEIKEHVDGLDEYIQ
jgi:arsenate reductase